MIKNRLDLFVALFVLGTILLGTWLFTDSRLKAREIRSSVYTCPSWVSVTRTNVNPRWQLTNCVWQDIDTSGGNHNLYFVVTDQNGAPTTVYAHQAWPDGDVAQMTLGGQTNFGLYGGSFDPNHGEVGAYCGYVESRATSDVVCGMGLPLNQHVNYILTFKRVSGTISTVTPITPPLTPPVGDYVLRSEFRQLLIENLQNILGGK